MGIQPQSKCRINTGGVYIIGFFIGCWCFPLERYLLVHTVISVACFYLIILSVYFYLAHSPTTMHESSSCTSNALLFSVSSCLLLTHRISVVVPAVYALIALQQVLFRACTSLVGNFYVEDTEQFSTWFKVNLNISFPVVFITFSFS